MSHDISDAFRLVAFTTIEGKRVFIPMQRFVSLTDDPQNEGCWSLSYLFGDKVLYNLIDEIEARYVFEQLSSPHTTPARFESREPA